MPLPILRLMTQNTGIVMGHLRGMKKNGEKDGRKPKHIPPPILKAIPKFILGLLLKEEPIPRNGMSKII